MMGVMDEEVYTAQSYLMGATGNCYIIGPDVDDDVAFIHDMLRQSGVETDQTPVRDYKLSAIDQIVEDDAQVVLVNCSRYTGPEEGYKEVYQWFELPDGFSFL